MNPKNPIRTLENQLTSLNGSLLSNAEGFTYSISGYFLFKC